MLFLLPVWVMVTTYIVLIAACNCVNCVTVWLYIMAELVIYFSTCALLSSPFATVDCLMNGLVGGVGGLIMPIDGYLKIMCMCMRVPVCVCVWGGGGLELFKQYSSTMYITLHTHNTQLQFIW
jgi:hypothetical protein